MIRMHHQGYEAVIEYDEDAEIFHGEIINLRDVITFQGRSAAKLKQAFADSVEDYLAFSAARGEQASLSFRTFPQAALELSQKKFSLYVANHTSRS